VPQTSTAGSLREDAIDDTLVALLSYVYAVTWEFFRLDVSLAESM
jgi:hypothetical protein